MVSFTGENTASPVSGFDRKGQVSPMGGGGGIDLDRLSSGGFVYGCDHAAWSERDLGMSGGASPPGAFLYGRVWPALMAFIPISTDTLEFDKNYRGINTDFEWNYTGMLHKSHFYENCAKKNLIFLTFLRII